MTNTEVIKKLRIEQFDLMGKVANLNIFILTNKYKTLEQKQQDLLKEQLKHMTEYNWVLIQRIALIQDLIDNGEK